MDNVKKYLKGSKLIIILIITFFIALIVKKTFSANENTYTKAQLQRMVTSAAISYYYNNIYSDYEQRLLDSDIKYPKITTSNNACVKVSQDTIKNGTNNSCKSTSDNKELYSTTFYRNTKITPEQVSRSNEFHVDCTGFAYLVYSNVLGYDLSEFYRLSTAAKYTSVQKNDDGTYSPNTYVSNSNKDRYNKNVNKFGRVWNSNGNIIRINNCIIYNKGDRTKCIFSDSDDLTNEFVKYNNGGAYAELGRKYVETSGKSEIVYNYIFKEGDYEKQFDTNVLPYFEKGNSNFVLQSGDMIGFKYANSGHVMIYVGIALNKNDAGLIHATGYDDSFDSFSVRYEPNVYNVLLKKKAVTDADKQMASISVYRPVNKYCNGSTCTNSNITENDKARVTFSGTKVEQYVKKKENDTSRTITKYNSVDVGDTIIYGLSLEDKRNYGYCSDSSKNKSNCPEGEWKETGTVFDNDTNETYSVEFTAPKGVTIKKYPDGYSCKVNSDKTTTCNGVGSRYPTFEALVNSDASNKLSSGKYTVTYKESTLSLSSISVNINNTINSNDTSKLQETINNFKEKNYTYTTSDQIKSTTDINGNITKMSSLDYIKYIYYNTFNIDLRALTGSKIINSLFYPWSESYSQTLGGNTYTYNPTAYFKKEAGTDDVSKMLVDGMYGGKKLIGNENSSRVKFIHTKNFEVGDIIVVSNDIINYFSNSDRTNMNLNFSLTKVDPSKDLKYYLVTDFDDLYTVLTYFNEFNVNSCGRENTTFSETNNKIKNNIINDNKDHMCSFRITKHLLYSSNLFAVLRPSQLYNDISYNVTVHLDDNNKKTASLKYNEFYNDKISTPTKAGYIFDGWYYDKELTKKATHVITHTNHDIYAKYSIAKYTLTIDLAGGSYNGDTSIEINSGETYQLPTVTREGYIFDSWEITGSGSSINNSTFTMGNENTTIKAIWKKFEITSDKYIVGDNDIKYIGEFNIDNIKVNYGTKSITDNKLVIKYNDKVLKEYTLVKIEIKINKYNIIDNNLLYFNEIDLSNITINNCDECTKSITDNKLAIKYNSIFLISYNLLKINTEYKINNDIILVDKDSDETILKKITSDDVELSIDGDNLIVKHNNIIIKTLTLSRTNETFNIKDYKLNNDKYIISGIKTGTNINDLTSKIDTNVSYNIIDISGNIMTNEILKTGYKIRLAFSIEPIEYTLSIKGDVLGTGTITTTGAKLIARHIIDGNVITEDAYLDAADYNSDGLIKMNDVVRMLKEKS